MIDSKLLQLTAQSKVCIDPGERAEIDAQIAYHASRVGQFDLARSLIRRIRAESGDRHPPSVAIWTIIADGVLAFFERLDAGSADRFNRAHALSIALKLDSLRALSAAWLAHARLGCCQYDSMVDSINNCLLFCSPVGDLASSRVGLVLANAYLYAGNLKQSRLWYESTRQNAILEGDRATLGAIMYNRAALALAKYRVEDFLAVPHIMSIEAVSSAVVSSSSFHFMTNNGALSHLVRMCEARLAMIQNRFDAALPILEEIRTADFRSLSGASNEFFDLEHAFCLFRLGRIGEIKLDFQKIRLESIASLDCDDRVVYLSALWNMYSEDINNISNLLSGAIREYLLDTARLQGSLQGVRFPSDVPDSEAS